MNAKLKEIGQKLGMNEVDIKSVLQRRRMLTISAVFVIALAFASNIYYLGMYYGGVSIEDFFSRFKILRLLFGMF